MALILLVLILAILLGSRRLCSSRGLLGSPCGWARAVAGTAGKGGVCQLVSAALHRLDLGGTR